MADMGAKRAFYKSATFRLALVYLAACAFAGVWCVADLGHYVHVAWSWWRPAPWPTRFVTPEESALADAAMSENWRARFCIGLLTKGYRATLSATPFLIALGALARMIARARMRAGQSEPFARIRAFAKKHVGLTVASPAMVWLAYSAAYYVRHEDISPIYRLSFVVAAPLVFLVQLLMARVALPALLAPMLDTHDETKNAVLADDFDFAAVALTREARLAVRGLAVLTAALVAALLALPTFDHLAIDISVALYVPIAIVSALYFRRASRIAVGLDGIHVHGSSRSRFYAFHELDDVRTKGGTIELLRGDRPVLRLQLHGPDAVRREALTERLAAAVARAREERDQPVVRFVNGATRGDLARAADGGGSYRHAAVSRDQLWAALEGPSVASSARVAAAEALAGSTDPSERERLRIATERCAEPLVRARLHELLEDEETDPAPILAARRLARG